MLIDITEPLREGMPHWPGDTPFTRRDDESRARGDRFTASAIHLGVHVGTHCDAPRHFIDGGAAVDELPLDAFTGPCRVLNIPSTGAIEPADWGQGDLSGSPRVLFRTRSKPLGKVGERFAHLGREAAEALAEAGARLVGIDTPSIDALDSTDFPAHGVLLGRGIAVLERLDLSAVRPGLYELFAFPLRLAGADGAPVRAVLRTL